MTLLSDLFNLVCENVSFLELKKKYFSTGKQFGLPDFSSIFDFFVGGGSKVVPLFLAAASSLNLKNRSTILSEASKS